MDVVSSERPYTVAAFPRSRRLIVDAGRAAHSRRSIRGFLMVDVTDVRRRFRDRDAMGGGKPSMTAYIAACVGRAVASDRQIHALRDLRGRLVYFDDIDINVSIEVNFEGRSFPLNHVVREADKRSVADINDEVHRIKHNPQLSPTLELARAARLFLRLPGLFRVWALRLVYRLPKRQKALMGTVGLTAVGMFGQGGGWGTAFQIHPLNIVVGGISTVPRFDGDQVVRRELLHLTLSFDHDIVDGAPAARFASHLRSLIEHPDDVIGG